MIVLGCVYMVAMAVLFAALLVRDDHTYRGTAATINVLVLFVAGLALAIEAVSR